MTFTTPSITEISLKKKIQKCVNTRGWAKIEDCLSNFNLISNLDFDSLLNISLAHSF